MKLSGWGNYPVIDARVRHAYNRGDVRAFIGERAPLVARGLGRSYGDAALSENVVDMTRMGRVLSFDQESGLFSCEAGTTLSDIVEFFLPRGYFLPVTPGTKQVTVGGAIASDVHGKNHHNAGTFADHVVSFELIKPDGTAVTCSRTENADLFHATAGGMGLTGVIVAATIRLMKVESSRIRQKSMKAKNLEDLLMLLKEHDDATYSVAWIDSLATKEHLGRGILMTGEHAAAADIKGDPFDRKVKTGTNIPFKFPSLTLNRFTVKAFNEMYYRKQLKDTSETLIDVDPFFYPLDTLANWNRVYGKKGFLQYQFIVPSGAESTLRTILDTLAKAGLGSFLSVLKLYGPENESWLCFPMRGYSIALDLPNVKGLFEVLDDMDRLVMEAGGRLYLTKDARMSAETFRAGYPNWKKFTELRASLDPEKRFNSLQSIRLEL